MTPDDTAPMTDEEKESAAWLEDRTVAREETTRRFIVVGVALCVIALIAAVFVGCDRASDRERDTKKACITSGGTWLGAPDTGSDGHCVRGAVGS